MQNIESMPRPEIILVADTVAREKNIDKEDVFTGVEVAIFLYETAIQEFKVSLRSNGRVDVSRVASYFGGGGHVRAAGCTMQGSVYDVLNNLTLHIEKQLKGADL